MNCRGWEDWVLELFQNLEKKSQKRKWRVTGKIRSLPDRYRWTQCSLYTTGAPPEKQNKIKTNKNKENKERGGCWQSWAWTKECHLLRGLTWGAVASCHSLPHPHPPWEHVPESWPFRSLLMCQGEQWKMAQVLEPLPHMRETRMELLAFDFSWVQTYLLWPCRGVSQQQTDVLLDLSIALYHTFT